MQETEMQILIAHSREVVCVHWDCGSFQVNGSCVKCKMLCTWLEPFHPPLSAM